MSSNPLLPLVVGLTPQCGNSIIAGYFADPSLVQYDGKFYVYATVKEIRPEYDWKPLAFRYRASVGGVW